MDGDREDGPTVNEPPRWRRPKMAEERDQEEREREIET